MKDRNQKRWVINNGPCWACGHMMKNNRNPNRLTYTMHRLCLKKIRLQSSEVK